MLGMVSYSRRPKSGQIMCYLNRTYHVLLTRDLLALASAPWRVHPDSMTQHKPVPGHEVKQHVYGNMCFGCGPDNNCGLQLEFHLDETRHRFVCHFTLPDRFEGPPSHSHGGIIATILDEAMGKVSKLRNIIAVTDRKS